MQINYSYPIKIQNTDPDIAGTGIGGVAGTGGAREPPPLPENTK